MEIDRKTLKALAADTRLEILKSLSKRRKMPSELSKELSLAASTVIEHLNRLEEAGLIRREETGHKWIYYQLTDKGESLVKPRAPIQFVLVLGITILLISVGFIYVTYYRGSNLVLAPQPKGFVTQSSESGSALPTISGNATNQTNTTNSTEVP